MDIPILIDSVKNVDDFQLTRCIYFRIEPLNPPVFTNSLKHAVQDVDNGMIRWFDWGVVYKPSGLNTNEKIFDSISVIDKTFEYLENEYWVDFAHIWVPNKFFPKVPASKSNIESSNIPKRGDVYRLPLNIFSSCHNFMMDKINQEKWFENFESTKNPIVYSRKETAAFQNWRIKQINIERERYHSEEYKKFRLPKKEIK